MPNNVQQFLFRRISTMSRFDKILFPPRHVQGMLELDRSKFRKSVEIPYITVEKQNINGVRNLKGVQDLRLQRLPRLKMFATFSTADEDEAKHLLFDPDKFNESSEEVKAELLRQLEQQTKQDVEFRKYTYNMMYEDWDMRRCIQSILPDGVEFSGFEQCGHIVHLNLREHLFPFRFTLGQILLDKLQSARTVVNKIDELSSEFRVMDFELVAGESDFLSDVVEQGIRYRLDYSKVFWNSRLNRVHEATFRKFDNHSVIFDVFAGVGPFILPAIKKRKVKMAFANDLNPECIRFLRESLKLNKIPEDRIETFVMDGSEFIRSIIPKKVAEFCSELRDTEDSVPSCSSANNPMLTFHAVMNLPGHSAEVLPNFLSFLSNYSEIREVFEHCQFVIHCHFFVKAHDDVESDWYFEEARRIVRTKMGIPIKELEFCRQVSTRKSMFCARILLTAEYAFGPNMTTDDCTPTMRALKRPADERSEESPSPDQDARIANKRTAHID